MKITIVFLACTSSYVPRTQPRVVSPETSLVQMEHKKMDNDDFQFGTFLRYARDPLPAGEQQRKHNRIMCLDEAQKMIDDQTAERDILIDEIAGLASNPKSRMLGKNTIPSGGLNRNVDILRSSRKGTESTNAATDSNKTMQNTSVGKEKERLQKRFDLLVERRRDWQQQLFTVYLEIARMDVSYYQRAARFLNLQYKGRDDTRIKFQKELAVQAVEMGFSFQAKPFKECHFHGKQVNAECKECIHADIELDTKLNPHGSEKDMFRGYRVTFTADLMPDFHLIFRASDWDSIMSHLEFVHSESTRERRTKEERDWATLLQERWIF